MVALLIGIALIVLGIVALTLLIPLKVTVCVGFLLLGVYVLLGARDVVTRG